MRLGMEAVLSAGSVSDAGTGAGAAVISGAIFEGGVIDVSGDEAEIWRRIILTAG